MCSSRKKMNCLKQRKLNLLWSLTDYENRDSYESMKKNKWIDKKINMEEIDMTIN